MSKITFFNRCYWPDSEATGQLLTELAEFLAAKNHEVEVVVGLPNFQDEKESSDALHSPTRNGVSIHRLNHSQIPKHKKFGRIRNLFSFTFAVRQWLKNELKKKGKGKVWDGSAEGAGTFGNGSAERSAALNDGSAERSGALNDGSTERSGALNDGSTERSGALNDGSTERSTTINNGSAERSTTMWVCETDPFLLPLVVGPAARRTGAKLCYYLQDIYPDVAVALGVTKDSLPIRFLRKRLKREYELADKIIVLDEDMRSRLVGWGLASDRIEIVPNWMDCSLVKPNKERNSLRTEWKISDDQLLIMHSGNMGMTQRLEVLIDAFQATDMPIEAQLFLVGNGAKRPILESIATGQSNVRFLGYQPKELLGESLSAADLHVVSMDANITGCLAPSKLYGILASATPVLAIVPRNNAVWKLVKEYQLGWCAEPGDTAEIVRAIVEAKNIGRNRLKEMGQVGRELAIKYYDREVCCSRFEKSLMS